MEELFIRINMNKLEVNYEIVPEKYRKMGGRWLTSQLVCEEIPSTSHPLGPNNKLVFAPGIVTGTRAPCSGRMSVGSKSPLTDEIRESNVGSPVAIALAKMGIKGIIVEGQPKEKDKLWILRLTNKGNGILEPAAELKGMGLYELAKSIRKKYGKANFIAIGPAGERCMSIAGICFSDKDGRPSRYAGRGGLGAVMGTKGLKAIIVEDPGTSRLKKIVDQDLFRTGERKLVEALKKHRFTKPGGILNSYGLTFLVDVLNEIGALPTCNFRKGSFEGANKISAKAIAETIKQRNGSGKTGHSCHRGCIIKCSVIWPKPNGIEHVSSLHYESLWALGVNCGIDDIDAIAEMIWMCNDNGLDTIEAGIALGLAMEAGLINFGDVQGAIRLLKECVQGTTLGRVLGNGAALTSKILGVTRVPAVKGMGMPGYDPRALKGLGVTYLTSPMAADHTAGYTVVTEVFGIGNEAILLSSENKVELSKNYQAITAFLDATGYCLFILFAILNDSSGLEGMVDTVNGVLGTNWTTKEIVDIGRRIIALECSFNAKAHKRLPEFMYDEPLSSHWSCYDVLLDEEPDKIWKGQQK
ncbi:MAG: aldehyde ferredoxin oxidoreductase C-terminal domain-containing protein [Thermacetogeniaceae bacterium]